MHNMNDYRAARKKEMLQILMANPNRAILLFKHLLERDLQTMLEKHILPRFCSTAPDSLVYKMMDRAYEEWKQDSESYELSVQLGE